MLRSEFAFTMVNFRFGICAQICARTESIANAPRATSACRTQVYDGLFGSYEVWLAIRSFITLRKVAGRVIHYIKHLLITDVHAQMDGRMITCRIKPRNVSHRSRSTPTVDICNFSLRRACYGGRVDQVMLYPVTTQM